MTTFADEPVHQPLDLTHWLSAVLCGARESMLRSPTVTPGATLPAKSSACPLVTLWPAPLRAATLLVGHVATPDSASAQLKSTTTSPLYQPAAFGNVVGWPAITGAVRSIMIPLTDAEAVLPALSATETGPAPRSAPSPVTVESAGALAGSIPDRPSWPVQWIVTSSRYQPAALPGVAGAPVSVGGVRSMLIPSTVAWAELPALSTAVPVADWPEPSLASVVAPLQPAMPDSASLQSNVTSTAPSFQPKPLAAGEREPVIDGAMPSILSTIACPASPWSSTLPARSALQNRIVWMPL